MNHGEHRDEGERSDESRDIAAIERNTFFDLEEMPDRRLNAITNGIIGAAIAVHRKLGPGYPESFYENGMSIEMTNRGLNFIRQAPFEVYYNGHVVGEGRMDFLVENEVIVELKAVESIAPIHKAIAISYLHATKKRLLLIINFRVKLLKDGIARIAL